MSATSHLHPLNKPPSRNRSSKVGFNNLGTTGTSGWLSLLVVVQLGTSQNSWPVARCTQEQNHKKHIDTKKCTKKKYKKNKNSRVSYVFYRILTFSIKLTVIRHHCPNRMSEKWLRTTKTYRTYVLYAWKRSEMSRSSLSCDRLDQLWDLNQLHLHLRWGSKWKNVEKTSQDIPKSSPNSKIHYFSPYISRGTSSTATNFGSWIGRGLHISHINIFGLSYFTNPGNCLGSTFWSSNRLLWNLSNLHASIPTKIETGNIPLTLCRLLVGWHGNGRQAKWWSLWTGSATCLWSLHAGAHTRSVSAA